MVPGHLVELPDRPADEQVLPEIGVDDAEAHRRRDGSGRDQRGQDRGRMAEGERRGRDDRTRPGR